MQPKGIAVETIGYLVLAIVALILIWIFLSKLAPYVTDAIYDVINGFVCYMCDSILGWWKGAAQLVGFCGGC
jgi:uncharacterized membrane protein YkgB